VSENTKIQWTDYTFNPWRICTPVSPGCTNCYAAAHAHRFGIGEYRKGVPRIRTSAANWKKPLKWNRKHDPEHPPQRVFCASLSDWLDDEVPVEWLADLLSVIHQTPNLTWQLLTKRPENWQRRIAAAWDVMEPLSDAKVLVMKWSNAAQTGDDGFHGPPHNVWIGTTCENQEMADRRIPELLKIPAAVRFISCEPMLGPVNFRYVLGRDGWSDGRRENRIHQIIFGGESGPNARPCNVEWIRDGVRQCKEAGVSAFVKQLGAHVIDHNVNSADTFPDSQCWPSVAGIDGARVVLRDKKGGDPAEWPQDLRVREFPLAPRQGEP
jgi:protein gp37